MAELPVSVDLEAYQEDEALIARIRAGEQDAWTVLVKKYARVVISAVSHAGVHGHDVDDLSQEAWFLAFRRLDQLKDPQRFCSWLRKIAYYRARQYVGTRYGRAGYDDEAIGSHLDSLEGREPAPHVVMMRELQREQIAEVFGKMPPRHVRFLTRCDLEGASYLDLVAEEGVPMGTVKRVLHRARKNFEKICRKKAEGLVQFL